jgi:ATP-dependent Lhr-like helicase
LLRSLRKEQGTGELVVVSAADPLNLTGILTPGRRVSSIASNRLLLRDGVPVAALEAGQFNRLDPQALEADRILEPALRVGSLPPALRPYYA